MRNAFFALVVIVVAGTLNPGCNCNAAVQKGCSVDDDCRTYACPTGQLASCMSHACMCNADLDIGDIGRYSQMALRGPLAYVCAYNTTYGDLMIGHQAPPGVVANWEFVDGVPTDEAPDNPMSLVRGGISDPGDDVGSWCSIQMSEYQDPMMSYYDTTHQSLKFTSFGAVRWHSHIVDQATGHGATGDNLGQYTSLTIDKKGNPAIAYYAEVSKGASGMRESQLRYAASKVPTPESSGDWSITVIDSQPMPAANPDDPTGLPLGIALFVSSARKPDDTPVIVYYDAVQGNLMYVDYDSGSHQFNAPMVLDGVDAMGMKTADVGQYPSVTVDVDGTSHISYVDATHANLLYVNTKTLTPEVVDDGYRPKDETTLDGLPAPVYHLVGASSSIQLAGTAVTIAYQDATDEELMLATSNPMTGMWTTTVIAGHATPFTGSYGFYAQNRVAGNQVVLSSYAFNQHLANPTFYVETFSQLLSNIIQ